MKNCKLTYLLFSAMLVLAVASCAERYEYSGEKEANYTNLIQAAAYTTTADYAVPVVDGYITTVSYNGLILARTSKAMNIKVPKQAVATSRGEELNVTYSEGQAAESYTNLWQTVMFEDSRNGDSDYNDIIVHANYVTSGNKLTVGVQPIALGSSKSIKIGFMWNKGAESGDVVVAENCRQDLFEGKAGFINTIHYDKHYSGFAKTVEVTLPDNTDALGITWYIETSGAGRLYTANNYEYKCIDNHGFPFGFALTTVGSNGSSSSEYVPSEATTEAWNAIRPDVSSWAKVPTQPAIPSGTKSGSDYIAWNPNKNSGNFLIASGTTFSTQIKSTKKTDFYVQGTMNLNSYSQGSAIYVLPGGVLNLSGTVQGVTIYNYGTVNMADGTNISTGTALYSATNLNVPNSSISVENSAIAVFTADVVAKSLEIKSGAYFYANSATLSGSFIQSNKTLAYINGSLKANTVSLSNNGLLYADCCIYASTVTVTNEFSLMVKGYLNATTFSASTSPSIYFCSGGLIEVTNFTWGNGGSGLLKVVGDEMGVLKVHNFSISGSGQFKSSFQGDLGIVYDNYSGDQKDGWSGVKVNTDDISVPAGPCSPGYNVQKSKDEGACWVSYPIEGVNINTCYNFSTWNTSTPDYTLLPDAQVFDINATNPAEGTQKKIFEVD